MKKIIALVMVIAMISALGITTSAEDAAAPTDGLIAHFTFDDAESGLTGGGATAHPKKFDSDFVDDEANIVEDEERGNVYDFGTRDDKRFLEVTKDDGSSLLAGVEQLTISFWFNSGDAGTNWYFWSTGRNEDGTVKDPGTNIDSSYTSSANTDAVDEYIGLLETGGSPKGEFYYLPVAARDKNAATGSLYTAEANTWTLFTMTIDADTTINLYVNGQWAGDNYPADEGRGYTFADILGEDPITFIGMALWGNPGEFSLGQIDDYYIYDTAFEMDSDELNALFAAQGIELEGGDDETEAPEDPGSTPSDEETEAPATTTAPTTDASTTNATTEAAKDEGGCGSTLGVSAVIVAAASVFGCAVIKKKH